MKKSNVCRKLTALFLAAVVLSILAVPCLATGGMGSGNGTGGGNAADNGGGIGGMVEDVIPGDQNMPGENANDNSMDSSSGESTGRNEQDSRETTGLTDDGKTEGNAQNGVVGESDTANASESESTLMDSMEQDENTGTNWVGIVIALLVIAALAAVVLAIFPKKKS